jgi:hypothetical protein
MSDVADREAAARPVERGQHPGDDQDEIAIGADVEKRSEIGD